MKQPHLHKYLLLLTLVAPLAYSAPSAPSAPKHDLDKVRDNIGQHIPVEFIKDLKPSPIEGLYQVTEGDNIVYYTKDGNIKVVGDVLDLKKRINYTQDDRDKLFLTTYERVFKDISPKDYIAFSPKDKPKHFINVFTDSDCPYCQKLHREVPALNNAGIEVRYFMYPRAGLNSSTSSELQSVWCSKNQQEAMDKIKSRQKIPAATCTNPIAKHMAMAAELGLRGTPFIITDKGERINGYLPASRLIEFLSSN